jgi:hypothetical protein
VAAARAISRNDRIRALQPLLDVPLEFVVSQSADAEHIACSFIRCGLTK